MSYSEKYKDYKWIKVKRYEERDEGTYEDHYHRLKRHHETETKFLIEEIRKLAAEFDEFKWRNGGEDDAVFAVQRMMDEEKERQTGYEHDKEC